MQPDLATRVWECLRQAGVPADRLVVEITESAAMTDPDRTARILGAMHELGVRLAWEFNPHVQVTLGYNLLYWTNVVRPGDQIDPIVNVGAVGDPGQLGGSPHPLFMWHSTGFWAQGLTTGVQISL